MLELESLPSFPPPALREWEDKVKKELKITDLEKLSWECLEGVTVQALYARPELQRDFFPQYSETRASHHENIPWESICPLPGEIWKKQIEEALSAGISHFWLPSDPDFDPKELIAFFSLKARPDLHFATSESIWLELAKAGKLGSVSQVSFPGFKEVSPQTMQNDWDFRFLYEQGGDLTHQMAVVLAAIVESHHVRKGSDGSQQIPVRCIHLSVGTGFYREIAKFRVLPLLIRRVLQELGLSDILYPKLMAHTSSRDLGQKDPAMNALRNSYAALAALLGGCSGLCIHPRKDHMDLYQLRLARNIHLLLLHEGKIQQVADPLGGAYFLEELGQALGAKAWTHFLQIEEEGGLQQAWEKGLIEEWMRNGSYRYKELEKKGYKLKIGEDY